MISTGRTIRVAVEALLAAGALPKIYVAATHGLFVDGAWDRLRHPAIRSIFSSDSVSATVPPGSDMVTVSIAPLLAETIQRLRADQSLGELYARPTTEAARETLVLA
jgi:ribose-phosphate pyrophosphokinase